MGTDSDCGLSENYVHGQVITHIYVNEFYIYMKHTHSPKQNWILHFRLSKTSALHRQMCLCHTQIKNRSTLVCIKWICPTFPSANLSYSNGGLQPKIWHPSIQPSKQVRTWYFCEQPRLGMRGAMSASQICMPTKSQKQPEVENQKHKSPSFLLPRMSEFSLTEPSPKSKFVKDTPRFLG